MIQGFLVWSFFVVVFSFVCLFVCLSVYLNVRVAAVLGLFLFSNVLICFLYYLLHIDYCYFRLVKVTNIPSLALSINSEHKSRSS